MTRKYLITAFMFVAALCLMIGTLAGYLWGGWYEWEKGYRFALRQICAGDAETVRLKKDALAAMDFRRTELYGRHVNESAFRDRRE